MPNVGRAESAARPPAAARGCAASRCWLFMAPSSRRPRPTAASHPASIAALGLRHARAHGALLGAAGCLLHRLGSACRAKARNAPLRSNGPVTTSFPVTWRASATPPRGMRSPISFRPRSSPRAARRSGRPVIPRPIARHRAASIALPPGREVAGFQALASLQPEDADPLIQQLAQQLGVGGVDRHVAAPPNVERGL